jgi:hypothetical protein
MSPRRIVLFSPYPPNIGGGSVILKSLIPQLEAFSISWLYTGLRDLPRDKYEAARDALFGTQNVIRLANCLADLSAV